MENDNNASTEAGVSMSERPPKENLVRAVMPGAEIRETDDGKPVLFGHFARFNEWTEINSAWEGRFMERIAPGAFTKTISENRGGMKVLYDHGHDPSIGNKPLGTIADLREDDQGASYEVQLFDTSYVRDLLPGLQAGAFGASFRFKVMREEFEKKPERSDHNPDGLPERTLTEARVMEFGPVTFPAYEGATAGVRSLTDEWILAQIVGDPDRVRALFDTKFGANTGTNASNVTVTLESDLAPSTLTPAIATSVPERREINRDNRFKTREDFLQWASSQS